MKIEPFAHLTYCSNIHPAHAWDQVFANLQRYVPAVRQRLGHVGPFGLGLRLSAAAAHTLNHSDQQFCAFSGWLDQANAYVFTLNGFPYGPFHGQPVKEQVYRPHWGEPARLRYSQDLLELMVKLCPPDSLGTVSTVPVGFRFDPIAQEAAASDLIELAAMCWRAHQDSGIEVCFALEPEPRCVLETTLEVGAFVENMLLSPTSRAQFAQRTGTRAAEREIRRYLGVCYDICHAAVAFEPPECAAHLAARGIRIAKCQVTSALHVSEVNAHAQQQLRAYCDDVYLHQVVVESPNTCKTWVLDLPEALRLVRERAISPYNWRVHVHVPVFAALAAPLQSTREFTRLALAAIEPHTTHFEVETYTWDVLPETSKSPDLADGIARELEWTRAAMRPKRR